MSIFKVHGRNALTASSFHRWRRCPGSVLMSKRCPKPKTSAAAATGTKVHLGCEVAIKDIVIKGKEPEERYELLGNELSAEEVLNVRKYVEFVNKVIGGNLVHVAAEEYTQAYKQYGMTCIIDCLIIPRHKNTAGIVDYKNGVYVPKGDQLEFNAAALYKNDPSLNQIKTFYFTPNADGPDYHMHVFKRKDCERTLEELRYNGELIGAMLRDESFYDAKKHIVPGDHCKYCPAAAVCSKSVAKRLPPPEASFDLAKKDFALPSPDRLSDEQLVAVLGARGEISSWLKQVEEYMLDKAEAGSPVPGTSMGYGRANRRWRSEDDAVAALTVLGVDPYDKKMRSPASIEKELGKGKVDALVEKPKGKRKLILHGEDDSSILFTKV